MNGEWARGKPQTTSVVQKVLLLFKIEQLRKWNNTKQNLRSEKSYRIKRDKEHHFKKFRGNMILKIIFYKNQKKILENCLYEEVIISMK